MIPWFGAAVASDGADRLPDGVFEEVRAGARVVRAHRDGASYWIGASDGGEERALVPTGGDRLAISPDGSQVAFVAPRDGAATVFVVPFARGDPRPVTPAVVRMPGRSPEGFVAPPADRSLRFVGDALCWTAPAGGETCRSWR